MPNLSDISIHAWIQEHGFLTEKGEPLTFKDHPFLFDIYGDLSPLQAIMKAAQVGASTMMNIKPFWMADKLGVEIIYTLPTDSDVVDFVGSKTNRLIAQNRVLQGLTKDRDTIENKRVHNANIFWRGTWTKKAAMMLPADVLIHDEVDASKQDIISDYETRIKHSKWKWRWYFSHPTTENVGVHKYWLQSDQKHWFVKCPHCGEEDYLSWPDSIDIDRKIYICKVCKGELSDDDRRQGRWVAKYLNKEFSGYWVSSLVCPWIPASEIVNNYFNKDPEYFYTKVLGLPYVGGGNKVTKDQIMRNLTQKINSQSGRIVIGCDTGVHLHYVVGNQEGLFYYGETDGYDEIESFLKRWPKSVIVFDQGGDLVSPRKLREKYPGRVFLCHYRQDRKTMQLIKWGESEEFGNVVVDRNRMIQMVLDEFTDKRIPIQGSENDWYDFWLHFNNIFRSKEENALGVMTYKWERTDADHWVHAAVYWRVGMAKFGQGEGDIMSKQYWPGETGVTIRPDGTVPVKELNLIMPDPAYDYRIYD